MIAACCYDVLGDDEDSVEESGEDPDSEDDSSDDEDFPSAQADLIKGMFSGKGDQIVRPPKPADLATGVGFLVCACFPLHAGHSVRLTPLPPKFCTNS